MKNVAIFGSGTGTNFVALADSHKIRKLSNIKLMVCDKPKAPVIERAKERRIDTFVFNPKSYDLKKDYEKEILKRIKDVDFIFLAGYMRIISPYFLEKFKGKIINIHPSLLPAYKGIDSIKRAYEDRCKYIGVTIHFVNEKVDGGTIICQDKLKVDYKKSLNEVTQEIHEIEHELYVKTVVKLLEE